MSRTLEQLVVDLDVTQRSLFRLAVLQQVKGLGLRIDARAKLNATTSPHVRSNRLRASIGTKVDATDDRLQLTALAGGSKVRYARIQEKGGTIVPKNGRFLAIPTDATKTAAGDLKAEFAGGWRSVTGTFVLRTQNGLFIARADPKAFKADGSHRGRNKAARMAPQPPQVLATLVRSVRLPPTLYLKRAIDAELPVFEANLRRVVGSLLATGKTDGV